MDEIFHPYILVNQPAVDFPFFLAPSFGVETNGSDSISVFALSPISHSRALRIVRILPEINSVLSRLMMGSRGTIREFCTHKICQ